MDKCDSIGMLQSIGTCWFNSIFNNLLLSQRCFSIFYKKYNDLPKDEKEIIQTSSPSDTCPLILRKSHFFHYFYMYHVRSNKSKLFNYFRKKDAQKLINKLELRSPKWEKERLSQYPQRVVENLFNIILEPNEYIFQHILGKEKLIEDTTKFFILKNGNFLTIKDIKDVEKKAPKKDFVLDHAVIQITFDDEKQKKSGHVVAGYMCNDEYFIYDSNDIKYRKIDWRNKSELEEYGEKYGTNIIIGYNYLCYVRV